MEIGDDVYEIRTINKEGIKIAYEIEIINGIKHKCFKHYIGEEDSRWKLTFGKPDKQKTFYKDDVLFISYFAILPVLILIIWITANLIS